MKTLASLLVAGALVAVVWGAPVAEIRPERQKSLTSFPEKTATWGRGTAVEESFLNDLHIGALWFPAISNKGYVGYSDVSAYYPGGGDQSNLWQAGMWAGGYVEGKPFAWCYVGSEGSDSDPAHYDTLDEEAVVNTEDDLGLLCPYRLLATHVNTALKPYLVSLGDTLDGDMGMDVTYEWHQWGVREYDNWVFIHVTIAFARAIDDFWWGWMSDCDVGDVNVPYVYFDDFAGWDDTQKFCYMRDWDYDPLPGDTLWLSPNVIGQTLLAAPPVNGPVTAPTDNTQRWASKNYWSWYNDVSSVQDRYDRLSGVWANPFPPDSAYDYRILNGVGPYDVSAGDTAHFWMAYVLGEGYDDDSHARYGMGTLADHVQDAQAFFDGGMVIPPGSIPPRAPDLDPDFIADVTDDEIRIHWAPYVDIAGGAIADSFFVCTSTASKLGPWQRVAAFDNSVDETQVQLTPGLCTYVWVQAYDTGNSVGSDPYALSSRLYKRDNQGVLRANHNTITCVYPAVQPAVCIQNVRAEVVESVVELTWDIGADEAIQGFVVYRSAGKKDAYEIINARGLISCEKRKYVDGHILGGTTYHYILGVKRECGSEVRSQAVTVKTKTLEFSLAQNHPNPFNPTTIISFTLPEEAHANLSIFNLEGKLVKTLIDRVLDDGFEEATWDGTDARGNPVSSGVYFYRLKAGNRVQTRKMVLLQ